MSQDELKIKVVLDDAEFKEQFIRLRRELEQEGEYRQDRDGQPGPEGPEGPPGPPGEGGADGDILNRLDQLEQNAQLSEGQSIIPPLLGSLTVGDLEDKLRESIRAGRFKARNVGEQRETDESVRRLIEAVEGVLADEEVDRDTGVDSLSGSGHASMLKLHDIINRVTETGRLAGLSLKSKMARFDMMNMGGSGGEGWIHKMQKAVAVFGFESAGKEAITEFGFPGPSGRGVTGGGRMDVASFYDIATLTDKEGHMGMLQGASVAEAAGKFLAMGKANQLAGYSQYLLRELYWRFYPDKRHEEVPHEDIEKWIDEVIKPAAESGQLGDNKLIKPFFVAMEGRKTVKNVEDYAHWVTMASTAMRKLSDLDMFAKPETFQISGDAAYEARTLYQRGELEESDVPKYISGRMYEENPNMDSDMRKFFNKLVGTTPTKFRKIMADALGNLGEEIRNKGHAISLEETADLYVQKYAEVMTQYGASHTEGRTVARDMRFYRERGPVASGFEYDIGGRLYSSIREYAQKVHAPTDEEVIESMVGYGGEEESASVEEILAEIEADDAEDRAEVIAADVWAGMGGGRADTTEVRAVSDSGEKEFQAWMTAMFGRGGPAAAGLAGQLKHIKWQLRTEDLNVALAHWKNEWRGNYQAMSMEQKVASIQEASPEARRLWLQNTKGLYKPVAGESTGPSTAQSRGWRGGLESRPHQDPISVDMAAALGREQETLAEVAREAAIPSEGIGMDIDPVDYSDNMEKIAVRMGFKKAEGLTPYGQLKKYAKNKEAQRLNVVSIMESVVTRFSTETEVFTADVQNKIIAQLGETGMGDTDLAALTAKLFTGGESALKNDLNASIIPEHFPDIIKSMVSLLDERNPARQVLDKGLLKELKNAQFIMSVWQRASAELEPMTNLSYPWM